MMLSRSMLLFSITTKIIIESFFERRVSQSDHIEMIVKKYVSNNFNLIHGVIEEGVRVGVFKKQDTALSTFSLVGMILYYFTYEPIFTRLISSGKMEKPITEYLPDHMFNLFMEGVKG